MLQPEVQIGQPEIVGSTVRLDVETTYPFDFSKNFGFVLPKLAVNSQFLPVIYPRMPLEVYASQICDAKLRGVRSGLAQSI